MSLILEALAALLLLFIYFWGLLLFAENVSMGSAFVLTIYVAEAIFIYLPSFSVGIYVYPQDLLFLTLGLAGALRMLRSRRFTYQALLILALGALSAFSVMRGFLQFSIKQAGNESRADAYLIAALLYFASFAYDRCLVSKIIRQWLIAATVLLALCLFRWAATGLGLAIVAWWSNIIAGFPFRVLVASQAYFLLIAAMLSLHLKLTVAGSQWSRNVGLVLLPTSVLLQHRTVWVCAAAGLLFLTFGYGRKHKRFFSAMILSVLAAMAVASIMLLNRAEEVTSFQEAVQNRDDWVWRVQGWQELYDKQLDAGLISVLIGSPYGTGFDRTIDGQSVDVATHNYYLNVLLRQGFVGLLCLIAFFLSLWRKIGCIPAQLRTYLFPDKSFWQILVLMTLLYSCAYSPSYAELMLLGILVGMLSSSSRVQQQTLERAMRPASLPNFVAASSLWERSL